MLWIEIYTTTTTTACRQFPRVAEVAIAIAMWVRCWGGVGWERNHFRAGDESAGAQLAFGS